MAPCCPAGAAPRRSSGRCWRGTPRPGWGSWRWRTGLDTGPVLLERRIPIPLLQNAFQLGERLAQLTGELLVEALPRIEAAGPGAEAERLARLGVRPQPEDGATYARLLTKEDCLVRWDASALALHRRVMGLYPNAACPWRGERLKLLATEPLVLRLADQLSPVGATLARRWGGQRQGAAPVGVPGHRARGGGGGRAGAGHGGMPGAAAAGPASGAAAERGAGPDPAAGPGLGGEDRLTG